MTYRAKPVTQRDGSRLANSNCRMASIATGLDYHTLGRETSTGAKMRSYTDDQEGGTDSGDARQSWIKGYIRVLRVKDGNSWADAVEDLRAGRLVHLDVWHAAVGTQTCLSGSGQYGHTMAVAPESEDGKWLVADPWCKPARWQWVDEAKLKAGAEEWGGRVFAAARGTGGLPPRGSAAWVAALVAAARRLMSERHPGNADRRGTPPAPEPDYDTGGPRPILYTTTAAHAAPPVGATDVGIYLDPRVYDDPGIDYYLDTAFTIKVSRTEPGGKLYQVGFAAAANTTGRDTSIVAIAVSTTKVAEPDSSSGQRVMLWVKRAELPAASAYDEDWADAVWSSMTTEGGATPPPTPGPPPGPTPEETIKARDAQWELALRRGEAWPSSS